MKVEIETINEEMYVKLDDVMNIIKEYKDKLLYSEETKTSWIRKCKRLEKVIIQHELEDELEDED